MNYPTSDQIQELNIVARTYVLGDNLAKLAAQYYGDSTLWYVIAFYNLKIEQQFKLGDIVYIPLPLDRILRFMEI